MGELLRVLSSGKFVHRNTLRQRLARIETLTKINLTQTEDWLPLHFAVKLTRLRKVPG